MGGLQGLLDTAAREYQEAGWESPASPEDGERYRRPGPAVPSHQPDRRLLEERMTQSPASSGASDPQENRVDFSPTNRSSSFDHKRRRNDAGGTPSSRKRQLLSSSQRDGDETAGELSTTPRLDRGAPEGGRGVSPAADSGGEDQEAGTDDRRRKTGTSNAFPAVKCFLLPSSRDPPLAAVPPHCRCSLFHVDVCC